MHTISRKERLLKAAATLDCSSTNMSDDDTHKHPRTKTEKRQRKAEPKEIEIIIEGKKHKNTNNRLSAHLNSNVDDCAFAAYRQVNHQPPMQGASYLQTPEEYNNSNTLSFISHTIDAVYDANQHPSPPISPPEMLKMVVENRVNKHNIISNGIIYLMNKELRVYNSVRYQFSDTLMNKTTPEKRSEMVWEIIDLSKRFSFHAETSWIAVEFMDRYLQKIRVCHRKQYNLLCMGVVYLASKIEEELMEPNVSDVVKSAKLSGICARDVLRMEKKILNVLNWDFEYVTPHKFLCEFLLEFDRFDFQEVLKRAKPYLEYLLHSGIYRHYHSFSVAVACFEVTFRDLVYYCTRSMHEEMQAFRRLVQGVLTSFPEFSHVFFKEIKDIRSVFDKEFE